MVNMPSGTQGSQPAVERRGAGEGGDMKKEKVKRGEDKGRLKDGEWVVFP